MHIHIRDCSGNLRYCIMFSILVNCCLKWSWSVTDLVWNVSEDLGDGAGGGGALDFHVTYLWHTAAGLKTLICSHKEGKKITRLNYQNLCCIFRFFSLVIFYFTISPNLIKVRGGGWPFHTVRVGRKTATMIRMVRDCLKSPRNCDPHCNPSDKWLVSSLAISSTWK